MTALTSACVCRAHALPAGTLHMFTPSCPVHGGSGLTGRQREVALAIETLTDWNGTPPTWRELGRAVGISSTNAVHDNVKALVRKGVVSRGGRRQTRSVRVVPLVEQERPAPKPRKPWTDSGEPRRKRVDPLDAQLDAIVAQRRAREVRP